MRLSLTAFVVMIVFVVGAGIAQAQSSRLYFAGYLGLNTFTENNFSESTTSSDGDIEHKNSISIAGALGLRLSPQLRIEGEISRRDTDMDRMDLAAGGTFDLGGELETWLYLLNVYYDINWDWKNFQPFLTAGIGWASHEGQLSNTPGALPNATDDSLGLAYTVGGGLKYRLNPDVAVTSNYRFIGTNDIEVDSYDIEFSTHEFRLGLEYDLPMGWLTESWFQ